MALHLLYVIDQSQRGNSLILSNYLLISGKWSGQMRLVIYRNYVFHIGTYQTYLPVPVESK